MGGVSSHFLLARAMSVRTYQINLESSYFCWPRLGLGGPTESTWNLHFCQPGLCLGGLTKSTWNPHTFAGQGFAWEALPNQLGIHCGPSFRIPAMVGGRRPCWRTGTPYNAMLVVLDEPRSRPCPSHFGRYIINRPKWDS